MPRKKKFNGYQPNNQPKDNGKIKLSMPKYVNKKRKAASYNLDLVKPNSRLRRGKNINLANFDFNNYNQSKKPNPSSLNQIVEVYNPRANQIPIISNYSHNVYNAQTKTSNNSNSRLYTPLKSTVRNYRDSIQSMGRFIPENQNYPQFEFISPVNIL